MLQILNLLFLIVLSAMPAQAFLDLQPHGTRQALLGNNGIALWASEGAGAYNPASLVGIKGNTLSASGSFLSISTFNIRGENLTDKSDAPDFEFRPILNRTPDFEFNCLGRPIQNRASDFE